MKISYEDGMLDITHPDHAVEIEFDNRGVLWVNVDGKCALRICQTSDAEVWFNLPAVHIRRRS